MRRRAFCTGSAAIALSACRGDAVGDRANSRRVVFKHQPLWGDPAAFRDLLVAFERANDVEIVTEALPNSSDACHQFFLTALEGGAADFDLFVLDVVWVAEFAHAGWVADLSDTFSPDELRTQFLAGAAAASLYQQRTWAVPWYADVGVLYRRTDLVPEAPTTYQQLAQVALKAKRDGLVQHGFVWQGRQYEGLVCNVYEAIWGHGGEALAKEGRLALDTPAARAGLEHLRQLVVNGISPSTVASQAEEESRRVFQDGRSAFMRNWPYAYAEAQRGGSSVRGKVGISPLPTADGTHGAGTLGGYHLAVNAAAPASKQDIARRLVQHLTSLEANVLLARSYGRNPVRRAAYEEPRILASAPQVASLLPMIETARPRPVTPYYSMISDVLQGEFSAVLVGLRTAEQALTRAQSLADHLMGMRP